MTGRDKEDKEFIVYACILAAVLDKFVLFGAELGSDMPEYGFARALYAYVSELADSCSLPSDDKFQTIAEKYIGAYFVEVSDAV